MSIIPTNMNELIEIFESKEYPVNKTPIETDYVIEELFKRVKSLLPQIQRVWHLIDEGDLFHVWIVESDKWNRKSLRRQIARNFQLREFADQLIFFVPSGESTQEWDTYSLMVITEDGIDPIDTITPKNPSMEVTRLWEQISCSDFTFSMYESVSLVQQAAHSLTAKKIIDALEISQEEVLGVFAEAGLMIHKERFVLPRNDSPLNNSIIDVQPLEKKPEDFIKENLSIYGNISRELYKSIDFILLLTQTSLSVASLEGRIFGSVFQKKNSKFILKDSFKWKKDKEIAIEILTALIAVIDKRPVFNAETFAAQYGKWSPLCIWAQNILLEYYNENQKKLDVLYSEWERRFGEVYKKNDTTVELFIKHTYLAFLIKLVLLEQYTDKFTRETPSFNDLLEYLNSQRISLFAHDFFHWADNVPQLHEYLFNTVHEADFDSTDIFRVIYQQMVSPSTRHALGEFYTPPSLAQMMVDETYNLGMRVLDPACGSGTFIVEIIKNIRRRGLTVKEQLSSIRKVYGFDINPIAVAVSKANILLNLNTITDESIPLNIYLANSLFPLEHKSQQRIDIGSYFIVPMIAISQNFEIPTKFYSPEFSEKFGDLLRYLDLQLMKDWKTEENFINELKSMLSSSEYDWLALKTGMKILKEVFIENIAKKIFRLCQDEQNHIWAYLLFNSIGIAQIRGKIDLVIGNPPWLVLNGVYSTKYKEKLKNLANDLDLKIKASNISNLEMSALFLYQSNRIYLKNLGTLAFIVSNAFVTGSQHDATRKFVNFEKIRIWKFSKDIFNIHNVCLFAKKNLGTSEENRLNINMIFWDVGSNKSGYSFNQKKNEIYKPIQIIRDENGNLLGVEKLISETDRNYLLPRSEGKESYYNELCYKGADLIPRTFNYIEIKEIRDSDIIIGPYMAFQAKKPWDFKPFDQAIVEREYIHQAVKSSELVPFLVLEEYPIFVPVNKINYNQFDGDPTKLKPNARKHFAFLKDLYKQKQKEGAAIRDFWQRINFQNGLIAERQRKPYKVVTPVSGGFVKSALIKGENIIIDYKLLYVSVELREEGYYLMGIMNSPCVTQDIKIRASEGAGGGIRDFVKRPWELDIPKFDPYNVLHQKIVEMSKLMENKVKNIAETWRIKELENLQKKKTGMKISIEDIMWKPKTIQNMILKKLAKDYEDLDRLVRVLFKGGK